METREPQSRAEQRRAAAGQSQEDLPGEETRMSAASLTCQTLAPQPEARAPPGSFLSCGIMQPLPPPELQDPRAESGTEAGKAATGPKPKEEYIGGTREGNPVFTFFTSTQQRFPGTASRQPRPAAPGPSPAAPPSSGRVSGGNTPPPRYLASAILSEAGRIQRACVPARRPAALRRGPNAQPC